MVRCCPRVTNILPGQTHHVVVLNDRAACQGVAKSVLIKTASPIVNGFGVGVLQGEEPQLHSLTFNRTP